MAAAKVLVAIDEGRPGDEALAELAPAGGSDRSMAWHLVLGTQRHLASIDAALAGSLSRGVPSLDPPVRAVLRMGAFEKLVAGTKAHAAVDQAVETARAVGAGRASGLVNAVMRKVRPASSPARWQELEHPSWLVARWDARYGPEVTEAWCRANAETPPLCLVARSDVHALAEALRAEGIDSRPATACGEVVPGVLRLQERAGRVESLPGFDEGRFWVQDAASAWMTDLVPEAAQAVLDACAAPGGKTLRLAARGAQVTSVDISEARLERLREARARVGVPGPVHVHDWTTGPMPGLGTFDAVLVDAPCTGLGTVRRRPEIRWRRGPEDPAGMAPVQQAILEACAAHVRPGGSLIHVVCTPEPEEGEQVVERFQAAHPDWTLEVSRGTAPPQDDEDAFQGFRLRAPGGAS